MERWLSGLKHWFAKSAYIFIYHGFKSHSFQFYENINKSITIMIIDLVKYVGIVMALFILGVWGIFLNRKNILIMLMSIELMLLAVNLNFIIFSVYLDDLLGQVFAIFILTIAAAESAIGLSILVIYSRIKGSLAVDFIHLMKG
jgi:NADH-quinone oxidoreductase subunit K